MRPQFGHRQRPPGYQVSRLSACQVTQFVGRAFPATSPCRLFGFYGHADLFRRAGYGEAGVDRRGTRILQGIPLSQRRENRTIVSGSPPRQRESASSTTAARATGIKAKSNPPEAERLLASIAVTSHKRRRICAAGERPMLHLGWFPVSHYRRPGSPRQQPLGSPTDATFTWTGARIVSPSLRSWESHSPMSRSLAVHHPDCRRTQ